MIRILVLCTGNSARSIIGEALFNALGGGRITAISAGSKPKGEPHPVALETLRSHGHSIEGLSSKSWDVFARGDAPEIHGVITVCDSAASEACPIWPGAPVQVHWGLPDPAYVTPDSACREAFEQTYQVLKARIEAVIAAEADLTDPAALKAVLKAAHEGAALPDFQP
ncbi:MAG: arsenate reductase ArsC [Oceanicaulis sp.]|uniref:arsenate reductase ArsC n=1 Tax=Glycocaulis sp. TaxID=1969725 RepID=UPI0025B95E6C|nr:arsenate reductase ArsC [Glycocaulis sp.]MCC5982224.1 arsenate reductase ArsC [Oceanicaulis sp.]MCH8520971.1 arsenate reductase ArsC [Glycocaulis sp.]